MSKYVVNHAAVAAVVGGAEVKAALWQVASDLQDIADKEVPKDTRKLLESSHLVETTEGWNVVYDTDYAAAVHDGSRAHLIPKNSTYKGSLQHWLGKDGKEHWRGMHPGTIANPWLARAMMILASRKR